MSYGDLQPRHQGERARVLHFFKKIFIFCIQGDRFIFLKMSTACDPHLLRVRVLVTVSLVQEANTVVKQGWIPFLDPVLKTTSVLRVHAL